VIYSETLGERHHQYTNSLNNLASLHLAMGERSKALPLFLQARDIYKETLGEKHPHYTNSLNNLASFYVAMGEHSKALPLFLQARAIDKDNLEEKHPDYALHLKNLGILYHRKGDTKQAEDLFRQALETERAHLESTLTALNDRQRLVLLRRYRDTLDLYLSVTTGNREWTARVYRQVLSAKGTLASRQAEEALARRQPTLRPLFDQLQLARAGLAHLSAHVPADAEQQKDWLQRFHALEDRKEQLEADLARLSDSFRRFLELRKAGPAEVAAALPPDTVLIDFVVYRHFTPPAERNWTQERRLLAFVLAKGRAVVGVELKEIDGIARAITAWREAVTKGQHPGTPAAELSRRLWAPLREHVGKAGLVLIAPDGALTALPFAALPGSKAGTYLLEETAIGYLSSGRQLLEQEADTDRPAGSGLLALGDLDYGMGGAGVPEIRLGVSRGTWAQLQGSRLEVERIVAEHRRAFPSAGEAVLLRGNDGDAPRTRRELGAEAGPRWRWLHLATHAFFDPPLPAPPVRPAGLLSFEQEHERLTVGRNPLLSSGLVLSGANRDPERGGLSALEVCGLDLRGCELAVLSACDSGRGAVEHLEGALGLQRGFQVAGARSVVSSLWSISDAATSVLMEEFYRNLWEKKLPRLEALRQAQLTVLREPKRVLARAREIRTELLKRGVSEAELAARGIGKESVERPALPPEGTSTPASPPAWWAAFVLSGEWR
jgi:CHAT domain-containing protein/Tfp pilus assembly protein PilF